MTLSGIGIERSQRIGTHNTRLSFLQGQLCSHWVLVFPVSLTVHTYVDSKGVPERSTGKLFISTPMDSKSGAARDPAVAPRALSRSWPAQPFERVGESGTRMRCSRATVARFSPPSCWARRRSSSSFSGGRVFLGIPVWRSSFWFMTTA